MKTTAEKINAILDESSQRAEVTTTPGPWEVQRLPHADGELWLQIGYSGRGPIAGISGDEVREPYCKPVAGMKYLVTPASEQGASRKNPF